MLEMEWLLYVSIAVIAVAFFILVVNISKTLRSLNGTLDSVAKTLNGLEGQLQGVTKETTELLNKTNALAEDIQGKAEKLNSVVHAVQGVGTSIQDLNTSVKRITGSVTNQLERNTETVTQVVQWGNVLMELRDRFKSKKVKDTEEKETPQRVRQYE